MKHVLSIESFPQEGDFQHTYSPLKNIMEKDGSIGFFRVKNFGIDLGHPVNLQCQPSYDGTVNLIINDDKNPPRIINSRFSKIEDNRFRIINRNQKEQTNLYKRDKWDIQTRLFRTSVNLPVVHFMDLNYFGQLKGGNYTFYFKFADDDYNQTDVLCESGIVSVFKGNLDNIHSISGTLSDELTDKSIRLKLINLDTSFSKLYVYYTREYSDLNGFRLMETKALVNPYEITESSMELIINGYEATENVDVSELNIKYNYVDSVKTQAQVQNMLFFGNVESTHVKVSELRNISQFFIVTLKQKEDSIGYIEEDTYKSLNTEYYSPHNIYYNLGYWPGEIYRLGVVYVMNDDSLSPVFPLRGCVFENVGDSNFDNESVATTYWNENAEINNIPVNSFLTNKNLVNSYGVFRNAFENQDNVIIKQNEVKPWYYRINLVDDFDPITGKRLYEVLLELGVKGYFFVRQKRIPTTLCQGFSVGVENNSSIPCLYNGSKYITEGFLKKKNNSPVLAETYSELACDPKYIAHHGLISVDAMLNPSLQSTLDGSVFSLQRNRTYSNLLTHNKRRFYPGGNPILNDVNTISKQCIYVDEDVPYKYVNGYGFSTRIGNAESIKEFAYFGKTKAEIKTIEQDKDEGYGKNIVDFVRGIYTPFIGVCGTLANNTIYNVRIPNYSSLYTKEYFTIRANDNSEFYTISNRFPVIDLSEGEIGHEIYRGDCYTNTVTVRINRNFTDPDVPIQDVIVDPNTWADNFKGNGYMENVSFDQETETETGETEIGNWTRINRSDVNAVQLGTWVTYKCLSNYNLGLRSEDSSYPDEQALVGNRRTFYPFNDLNLKSSGKISESKLLNDGYSATVGRKMHILAPDVPYVKDIFDTRVMFSNVNVEGDFKNGYRVFQGLSYKDIDRQYGAIVKLLDWGTNLLCIFEHGIAILPINEKALIQTTTEQSIHMYGAGVLQNQVSLISPDFGSIWADSIIRTPIGVYGVDTYAKKIWRYSTEKGLETISDMKVQRFLNDHMLLKEEDKYPIIALKNVKTHYNNYKGDVMFTFYNNVTNEEWNLCFNERMDKWITRYSWTPLHSENINNIFYSLDKKRAEILSYIYYNKNCTRGIRTTNNLWDFDEESESLVESFDTTLSLTGVDLLSGFDLTIKSITTTYFNDSGKEITYSFPTRAFDNSEMSIFKLTYDENFMEWKMSVSFNDMKRWFKGDTNCNFGSIGVPLYYKIEVECEPYYLANDDRIDHVEKIKNIIGVITDTQAYKAYSDGEEIDDASIYDNLLLNGFYVHGRAGVFNEIDYTDSDPDNQIKPTHWYGKQEPFEFEFVVNEDVGLHKIFENLVIISNRVQPKELEFEITGDVYSLFKGPNGVFDRSKKDFTEQFENVISKYDTIQNRHTLVINQELKDVEQFKRRLGNIHYKEDSWYITIDPIIKKDVPASRRASTRIRDKYLRVRVKYSGEDLVIITAIKNIYNLTHS